MRKTVLKFISFLVIIEVILGIVGYLHLVYGQADIFRNLRTMWIETAMSTGEHQWLATAFFPEDVVKEIMDQRQEESTEIGGLDLSFEKKDDPDIIPDDIKDNSKPHSPSLSEEELDAILGTGLDVLGQWYLEVGQPDMAGNIVLVNNKEQGIVISELKGQGYIGKAVLVDDPSRIFLSDTGSKENHGEKILEFMEKENALCVFNASGFQDAGGVGTGGEVIGLSVSQGESWGSYLSSYTMMGFDEKDRLIVGKLDNWQELGLRDAMQFGPTLIVNGRQLITGSSGWGLQPRTVMGQRTDGAVVILVVDGRQPGYSTGITMGQCADILMEYGCVNAAACDGGSSSILAYNNEIISKCCSPAKGGRMLPNAWVITKKS